MKTDGGDIEGWVDRCRPSVKWFDEVCTRVVSSSLYGLWEVTYKLCYVLSPLYGVRKGTFVDIFFNFYVHLIDRRGTKVTRVLGISVSLPRLSKSFFWYDYMMSARGTFRMIRSL